MKSWSGLEKIFRLSMGVGLGANALALWAALEFKQLIQNGLQDSDLSDGTEGAQTISLSSEEWRATAGIFDRKAYDRAKAKLEDQGIIEIQREGRVLRITLWPELKKKEEDVQNELKEEPHEGTMDKTKDGTINRPADRTSTGTSPRTNSRTLNGTGCGTNLGTTHGTRDGTPGRTSHSPHRGVYSSRKRRRDSLKRYSLTRYTLLRYPINSKIFNFNLYKQRNNEQRSNVQRDNVNFRFNPLGLNRNSEINSEISPEFQRLWQSEMGHALSRYEQEGLLRFLRMGFTEDLLLEALRYAVLADQRYMGYLLGVLRNWYNEGVRHLRDIPQARQSWEDQRFLQRKCESM